MATNPQQELIWEGRIHVGDEPGIFGNAHYNGIGVELPITVYRTNPSSTSDLPLTLVLETERVETFAGYPGHEITVTAYEPDPTNPYHSIERILARERLQSVDNNKKAVQISSGTASGPFFLTVRLRVDTTVNPGFYNDFLFVRLSLLTPDFYASFGFRNS